MPPASFRNVDEYIAAQPASAQVVLEQVCSVIREPLPNASEVISYKFLNRTSRCQLRPNISHRRNSSRWSVALPDPLSRNP